MKQKTIFDLLNDICYNKVGWEEQNENDRKVFQPYMINRWLSMHPDYTQLIAECQPYTDLLTPDQLYKFYLDLLPKKKFFTKYVSKKSESSYPKVVDYLAPKFECSKREMEDYLELVDRSIIVRELRKYGFDEKTIKKQFSI